MSLCHCQDVSVINTLCQCHCCCVTVSILLPAHHVSVGLCCCVRVLVSVHYVSVGVSLCQFQSISVSAMSSRASSLATSAERRWGWSSESFIMRTFQHVTFRFAVFFFLSCFFFFTARKRCPLTVASQPGRSVSVHSVSIIASRCVSFRV